MLLKQIRKDLGADLAERASTTEIKQFCKNDLCQFYISGQIGIILNSVKKLVLLFPRQQIAGL